MMIAVLTKQLPSLVNQTTSLETTKHISCLRYGGLCGMFSIDLAASCAGGAAARSWGDDRRSGSNMAVLEHPSLTL